MLILEGPDLIGKTTLAQRLLKDTRLTSSGYVYGHLGLLPDGWELTQYLNLAQTWLVQDRFHLSEIVYRAMDGGETLFTPELFRLLEGALRLYGAFTVVITAEEDVLHNRWGQRPEELISLTQIKRLNRLYLDVMTDGGEMGPWRADVDLHVHLTSEHPYVTEQQVNFILERYRLRMAALSQFNLEAMEDANF